MRRQDDTPKKRRARRNAELRRAGRRRGERLLRKVYRIDARRAESRGLPPPTRYKGAFYRWDPSVTRSRWLTAPEQLSFIDAPEDTVRYVASLERAGRGRRSVYIDLSDVKRATLDAVTVLRTLVESIHHKVDVRGNVPTDARVRDLFEQSGFFKNIIVVGTTPRKDVDFGRMQQQKEDRVAAEVASDLARFAAEKSLKAQRAHRQSYTNLVECMANTKHHASGARCRPAETWFAAVHFDKETRRTSFAFVDLGVGILRSANITHVRKLFAEAGVGAGDALLRVLSGEYESSTHEAGRGNGLPKIADTCRDGHIKRLVVVANNAYADVERGTGRTLSEQLRGTLFYWEIHPKVENDAAAAA